MSDRIHWTKESFRDLVLTLHSHFVGIHGELRKDKKIESFMLSAFLMSVDGVKLIVTAGHSILWVQIALNAGFKLHRPYIVDGKGNDASFPGFPYSWNDMSPWTAAASEEDGGFDFGVLRPYDNILQNLDKSGKVFLPEGAWDAPDPACPKYLLYGSPANRNVFKRDFAKVQTNTYVVDRLPKRPEDFPEPIAETLYGVVSGTESIKGNSGGPIFAVNDWGTYQLVALQSRWLAGTREIAAPLIRPLGHKLTEFMRKGSEWPYMH
jgi:hypothetical protein